MPSPPLDDPGPQLSVLPVVVLIPLLYVSLLYVIPERIRSLPRENHDHILWRFGSVFLCCVASPFVSLATLVLLTHSPSAPTTLGGLARFFGLDASCNTLFAVGAPLVSIAVLFLGPLAEAALWSVLYPAAAASGSAAELWNLAASLATRTLQYLRRCCNGGGGASDSGRSSGAAAPVVAAAAVAQGSSGATASPPAAATAAAAAPLFDYAALAALRALVVAPIGEEWVFRCNIIPIFVAAHIAPAAAVALSAVAFGGAHVHHAIEQRRLGHAWSSILASTALQLSYTSLFGVIAGIMLLRTGSAVGIILMHAFCNAMGLPSPTWLQGGGDGEGTQSPFWRWRHAFMAAYALGIFGFVAILAFGFGERQHQCVGVTSPAQLG